MLYDIGFWCLIKKVLYENQKKLIDFDFLFFSLLTRATKQPQGCNTRVMRTTTYCVDLCLHYGLFACDVTILLTYSIS